MIRPTVGFFLLAYGLFMGARAMLRGRRAARAPLWAPPPEPENWPCASVIIPAWRDRATLERCLQTVAGLDYPSYEVIVVAGGDDGTQAAALAAGRADSRIRVIEQLPRGKNAALNQGLQEARGPVVVLLDADSEVDPGWLKAMVRGLSDQVAATTGNYTPLRRTSVALIGEVAKIAEYEVRGRVILQGSGGIALRRDVLDTIGAFPEERISSDWDLDARVGLGGYRTAFSPGATIRTHRPASLREWWRNELRWRRLHLLTLARLRSGLLSEPKKAARHLYPYVMAWMIVTSAVGSLVLVVLTRGRLLTVLSQTSVALAGASLLRELGAVLEVFAYRPQRRLLPAFAVSPLLTALGWLACLIATLSPSRAKLQFKGARGR